MTARTTFILLLLIMPSVSLASVRINEIAWMGTLDSANNEWIELYNTGSDTVHLDGWILESVDGTPKINLSGVVQASGFFLLERTDDSTLPDIAADLIYTGALSNSGEVLVLKNSQGAEIDRVDASSGWPAGDNATKQTMQFSGSGWITATGTPKAVNAVVLASGAPSESSGSLYSPAVNSGSADASSSSSQNLPPQNVITGSEPKIFAVIPSGNQTAIAGAEIILKGEAFGLKNQPLENARYLWNFGDGSTQEGRAVSHTYIYPGFYIVFLNIASGFYTASDRIFVNVYPNPLEISEALPGGHSWIEVKNSSDRQIDISGWSLSVADKKFFFPAATFIGPQTRFVISSDVSGLVIPPENGSIQLSYPNGKTADVFEYHGVLKEGGSFIRENGTVVIGTATPGGINQGVKKIMEENNFIAATGTAVVAPKIKIPFQKEAGATKSKFLQDINVAKNDVFASGTAKDQMASAIGAKSGGQKTKLWLLIALGVGVFGAAGFFFLRRFSSE